MKTELTQNYLKECLGYNPDTGIFTRKKTQTTVGTLRKDGYLMMRANNTAYLNHRLAWFYVYGYFPKQIDHINNIRTDNRICNLREANRSENNQNQIKPRSNNKVGFLGVCFDKNNLNYRARIGINKKYINIGSFKTPEEAHNAYLQAKRQLHPFGEI